MLGHSPSVHRHKNIRSTKDQDGTIISITTISHPPAGFPKGKRTIALILLTDGTKTIGLVTSAATIGQKVSPCMRKIRTSNQGLHQYDIAYEPVVTNSSPVIAQKEFPGYILALSGPSGVGKSSVIKHALSIAPEIMTHVPLITTDENFSSEKEYIVLSKQEFLELKNSGNIVASIHDNDEYYGYKSQNIESIWKNNKIPVVITHKHLLQELSSHYGRRSILSCGLLPPGHSKRTMLSCLMHRLRSKNSKLVGSAKQLIQAKKEISFFDERADLFDHILINEDISAVAKSLSKIVLDLDEQKA